MYILEMTTVMSILMLSAIFQNHIAIILPAHFFGVAAGMSWFPKVSKSRTLGTDGAAEFFYKSDALPVTQPTVSKH